MLHLSKSRAWLVAWTPIRSLFILFTTVWVVCSSTAPQPAYYSVFSQFIEKILFNNSIFELPLTPAGSPSSPLHYYLYYLERNNHSSRTKRCHRVHSWIESTPSPRGRWRKNRKKVKDPPDIELGETWSSPLFRC